MVHQEEVNDRKESRIYHSLEQRREKVKVQQNYSSYCQADKRKTETSQNPQAPILQCGENCHVFQQAAYDDKQKDTGSGWKKLRRCVQEAFLLAKMMLLTMYVFLTAKVWQKLKKILLLVGKNISMFLILQVVLLFLVIKLGQGKFIDDMGYNYLWLKTRYRQFVM